MSKGHRTQASNYRKPDAIDFEALSDKRHKPVPFRFNFHDITIGGVVYWETKMGAGTMGIIYSQLLNPCLLYRLTQFIPNEDNSMTRDLSCHPCKKLSFRLFQIRKIKRKPPRKQIRFREYSIIITR